MGAHTSFRVGFAGATWDGSDLDGTVSRATDDGSADAHTSGRPCSAAKTRGVRAENHKRHGRAIKNRNCS